MKIEFVPEKTSTLAIIKNGIPLKMPYTLECVGYFSGSVENISGIDYLWRFPYKEKM